MIISSPATVLMVTPGRPLSTSKFAWLLAVLPAALVALALTV